MGDDFRISFCHFNIENVQEVLAGIEGRVEHALPTQHALMR
jgi:hypothetical protein